MASLSDLRIKLEKIDDAIESLATNGGSYSISDSHSVTSADIDSLNVIRNNIIKRILMKQGFSPSRVAPDFS